MLPALLFPALSDLLSVSPFFSLPRRQEQFQTNPDSYNGAVRENYAWSQDYSDLEIKVPVPKHIVKGKQVKRRKVCPPASPSPLGAQLPPEPCVERGGSSAPCPSLRQGSGTGPCLVPVVQRPSGVPWRCWALSVPFSPVPPPASSRPGFGALPPAAAAHHAHSMGLTFPPSTPAAVAV